MFKKLKKPSLKQIINIILNDKTLDSVRFYEDHKNFSFHDIFMAFEDDDEFKQIFLKHYLFESKEPLKDKKDFIFYEIEYSSIPIIKIFNEYLIKYEKEILSTINFKVLDSTTINHINNFLKSSDIEEMQSLINTNFVLISDEKIAIHYCNSLKKLDCFSNNYVSYFLANSNLFADSTYELILSKIVFTKSDFKYMFEKLEDFISSVESDYVRELVYKKITYMLNSLVISSLF